MTIGMLLSVVVMVALVMMVALVTLPLPNASRSPTPRSETRSSAMASRPIWQPGIPIAVVKHPVNHPRRRDQGRRCRVALDQQVRGRGRCRDRKPLLLVLEVVIGKFQSQLHFHQGASG